MMWQSYSNQLGLSAQAIAGHGSDHPHDPSDLLRCIDYCDGRFTTEELKVRMSGRSTQWGRLVKEWDYLVALLREEMDSRTDRRAPKTYAAMKRIINGGTECKECDSTGRGTECPKCKGTGRRSGGRCRASKCYGGADFCPCCDGASYHRNADSQ